MSSWRQASATSGSSTGVTTKDAPASFASRTAPGSHTVPTPTGYRPIVVAINPRIISKHEGTVFVTSIVLTPPSMAVRQAWKPASALSVRSTPHTPLGKASAIDFIDRLRLVEGGHHPGTCNQAPIESESAISPRCMAVSYGGRNTCCRRLFEELSQFRSWRLPAKGLTWSPVELRGNHVEMFLGVMSHGLESREVLPEQSVGVLVGASLPRAFWVTKIDLDPGVDGEANVLFHLSALVPSQ